MLERSRDLPLGQGPQVRLLLFCSCSQLGFVAGSDVQLCEGSLREAACICCCIAGSVYRRLVVLSTRLGTPYVGDGTSLTLNADPTFLINCRSP